MTYTTVHAHTMAPLSKLTRASVVNSGMSAKGKRAHIIAVAVLYRRTTSFFRSPRALDRVCHMRPAVSKA